MLLLQISRPPSVHPNPTLAHQHSSLTNNNLSKHYTLNPSIFLINIVTHSVHQHYALILANAHQGIPHSSHQYSPQMQLDLTHSIHCHFALMLQDLKHLVHCCSALMPIKTQLDKLKPI